MCRSVGFIMLAFSQYDITDLKHLKSSNHEYSSLCISVCFCYYGFDKTFCYSALLNPNKFIVELLLYRFRLFLCCLSVHFLIINTVQMVQMAMNAVINDMQFYLTAHY